MPLPIDENIIYTIPCKPIKIVNLTKYKLMVEFDNDIIRIIEVENSKWPKYPWKEVNDAEPSR